MRSRRLVVLALLLLAATPARAQFEGLESTPVTTASPAPVPAAPSASVAPEPLPVPEVPLNRPTVNLRTRFSIGLNYPWYQQDGHHWFGNLFGAMTDEHRGLIEKHMKRMKAGGIQVLRFWLFAAAGAWPKRDGDRLLPLPERFVEDLRWFIRTAARYDIACVPSIWDFYLDKEHPEYLSEDALRESLVQDVVKPLVRALKDEPGILVWEVMNEPEWMLSRYRVNREKLPFSSRLPYWPTPGPGRSLDFMRKFVKKHVDVIHAEGKGVTVGAVNPATVRHWAGLGLDLYQVHYYPVEATWFAKDLQFSVLPSVKLLRLDRPCVLGEFPPNLPGVNLAKVLAKLRSKGYAGAWAWAFFGDGYPENLSHQFSYTAREAEIQSFAATNR